MHLKKFDMSEIKPNYYNNNIELMLNVVYAFL